MNKQSDHLFLVQFNEDFFFSLYSDMNPEEMEKYLKERYGPSGRVKRGIYRDDLAKVEHCDICFSSIRNKTKNQSCR